MNTEQNPVTRKIVLIALVILMAFLPYINMMSAQQKKISVVSRYLGEVPAITKIHKTEGKGRSVVHYYSDGTIVMGFSKDGKVNEIEVGKMDGQKISELREMYLKMEDEVRFAAVDADTGAEYLMVIYDDDGMRRCYDEALLEEGFEMVRKVKNGDFVK